MDNRPIGVFDSGLGGLSVAKDLCLLLPNENLVYFGDTGRVPYGTKSRDTIIKYARQDEAFLMSYDVKMIIAACGTVSSVARSTGDELDVPFLGVVEPAAKEAVSSTKNGKIGVIGTSATVKSNSYKTAIEKIDSSIQIFQQDCPLFVSIVEQGWIEKGDEIALATAKRYLKPLQDAGVDTLILGCTHFPLIADTIGMVMGENVKLISSGLCAAKAATKQLTQDGLLNESGKKATHSFFVSDRPDGFMKTAKLFMGNVNFDSIEQVHIEEYGK